QLTNYGNGLGEIGWSFVPTLRPAQAGRGQSEAREANEERSIRRARSRMRRLILSVQADHLLTLTYRENVTDFKIACSDFSKFIRKMKTKLPSWLYIAVAENQKRGAWHWHIAVKGRQDVALIRSIWRHIVGEGNIDVNPPKANQKNPQLALVTYLCKYLGKGFNDGNHELNARRFRASHGIQVPITIIPLPDNRRHDASGYAVEMLKAKTGSVGYIWLGDSLPAGWACSWK
ncbi:MAG: rolling circle replication-associated protein, partial [Methylophilaceae bacterium]